MAEHSGRDFADLNSDDKIKGLFAAARLCANEATEEGPRPLFRDLPEAQPFPVHALGRELEAAAKAIETIIQCPIECAGNSVLAAASLAAQQSANVFLPIGQGRPIPLSLYLLTVLDSGERKTSADGMALKPVRDFERELAEAEAGERQAYNIKLAIYGASVKLLSKSKGDSTTVEASLLDLGPPPQPPLISVLAPSGDQTMEGLFRIYQHGRPSLGMLCDDAATFLGGHSLKAEQKASTTANLCRAWDGSKLERIRGGDGVTVLYDRRLACHLMVQPGVAVTFLSDPQFADQGLLARFLISAPTGRAGSRFRDDAKYQLAAHEAARDLKGYNAAINCLIRRHIRWKNENDRSLGIELHALRFSPEARSLYVDFANVVEADLAQHGEFATIKAFAAKAPEHAARIAGILTLVSDVQATSIDVSILANAIELVRYYLAEALRVWLQAWLESCIGLRQIYQLGPNSIRQADKACAAMTLLEDHGWVVKLPDGAVIDGRRSFKAWTIVDDQSTQVA